MTGLLAATTTVQQSTTSLILIAVIAGLGAVLAASIPIFVNGRQNRAQRKEDWARQDLVAARAIEAVAAAETVAAHAAETADAQAVASAALDTKLTRIAHQTDGLYTAALESELRALVGQAATLREVVALRAASDSAIDDTRTLAVIEAAEQRIAELEEGLARRREYQADKLTAPLSELGKPLQVEVVNADPVDVSLVEPAKPEPSP